MLDQRLPTTLTLSALALIFSGAGVIQHNPTTPLFTALIIIQALSLIVAPNHPRISTATYIAAFITALLVGYSTGFELFLGVFLITALTATGHHILAILSATTITLGGFYSPTNARIEFDIGALIIFITIIALAHLLGLWIHHTHQQHLNSQRTQRIRRQQLTSLLHDTIAADLTSAIVQLEKLAITTPERAAELKNVARTSRDALDKTRQLLTTLNTQPNSGSTPSLPTTLEAMSQRLHNHGFAVTITTDLTTPVTMSLHNTALERVLSETITNIIKHATPQSLVTVSATSDNQGVTLIITNAYIPKKKTSESTCLGLTSMSNTLYTVGGALNTRSDNKEWVTTANIPFCRN
ncbi:sensor histidine kinase [Corynebacterium riegelii]|uniref:sensor histidine kinase n=1 Tax=Corynebacterium riegelii TaxID=156976 RepID=UPI00288B3AD9|nr:histidine kinase [Corynebacterium riegelii]